MEKYYKSDNLLVLITEEDDLTRAAGIENEDELIDAQAMLTTNLQGPKEDNKVEVGSKFNYRINVLNVKHFTPHKSIAVRYI